MANPKGRIFYCVTHHWWQLPDFCSNWGWTVRWRLQWGCSGLGPCPLHRPMIPSYSPQQTSCARSNGAFPLSIKPLSLSIDSFIQKLKRNHYKNWPILSVKNSYCLLRFVPKNEFKILIIIAQFALFLPTFSHSFAFFFFSFLFINFSLL